MITRTPLEELTNKVDTSHVLVCFSVYRMLRAWGWSSTWTVGFLTVRL